METLTKRQLTLAIAFVEACVKLGANGSLRIDGGNISIKIRKRKGKP